MVEIPAAVTKSLDVAGFGEPPKSDFWLSEGQPQKPNVHVAFRAISCES